MITDKDRCISCGCVVDEKYHGHHSAADCVILKYAEESAEEAREEAAERANKYINSVFNDFDGSDYYAPDLRAAILKEATE